jgi:hypothetical protein
VEAPVSFTDGHHVFGSVSEEGLNDLIEAFFNTRHHYFEYGSAPLVAASSASVTQVAPLPFPFVPGGVPYKIEFGLPVIDLFKPAGALPPPLVLHPGEFVVRTKVEITVGCMTFTPGTRDKPGSSTPISTVLEVWAVGKLFVHTSGGLPDWVELALEEVEIVDVKPDSLESVLECLIRMLLQGALSGFRLPIAPFTAGFITLIVEDGPMIDDNQLKVFGTVV